MTQYRLRDRGQAVIELQNALEALGYSLAKHGADGSLGLETLRMLELYATDVNALGEEFELSDTSVPSLNEVAQKVLADYKEVDALAPAGWDDKTLPGGSVVDVSPDVDLAMRIHRVNGTKGSKALRDWKDIDAIVLHQTGTVNLPNKPELWTHIPIHVGVPTHQDHDHGDIYHIHDFRQLCWHAQGLSRRSIGIEVGGNFLGYAGKRSTWWRAGGGPTEFGPDQRRAVCAAIKWIIDTVEANGGRIQHIFGHVQSSDQRKYDPGEEIWRACGAWAQKVFGLGSPDFKVGTGSPIPKEWR